MARPTQKDILKTAVDQFGPGVVKRGIIKNFYPAAYTADVLFTDSSNTFLKNIPVARDIPSRFMIYGANCAVLILDPQNPRNCVVASIYSGQKGGPNSASAFNDTQNVTTAANDTTNWYTLSGNTVNLSTGPGAVMIRADGSVFLDGGTGGGSICMRILCTLNQLNSDGSVTTSTNYGPNGGSYFIWTGQNNWVFAYGFSCSIAVPYGNHTFKLQMRLNSVSVNTQYAHVSTATSNNLYVQEIS